MRKFAVLVLLLPAASASVIRPFGQIVKAMRNPETDMDATKARKTRNGWSGNTGASFNSASSVSWVSISGFGDARLRKELTGGLGRI